VFRRSGGHAYRYVIPGPIGSLLAPLNDKEEYKDLPFACTLCNSCEMVCPVKIPFSKQLVKMREYVIKENFAFKFIEASFHSPFAFKLFSKIIRLTPKSILKKALKEWSMYKELPNIPPQRFING
jgi:L-lactate dehydrogenase complex protein LldF